MINVMSLGKLPYMDSESVYQVCVWRVLYIMPAVGQLCISTDSYPARTFGHSSVGKCGVHVGEGDWESVL